MGPKHRLLFYCTQTRGSLDYYTSIPYTQCKIETNKNDVVNVVRMHAVSRRSKLTYAKWHHWYVCKWRHCWTNQLIDHNLIIMKLSERFPKHSVPPHSMNKRTPNEPAKVKNAWAHQPPWYHNHNTHLKFNTVRETLKGIWLIFLILFENKTCLFLLSLLWHLG